MPSPSPTRKALYELLSGDSDLSSIATGGVYHRVAPENTEPPYVIFHRQAGTEVWSMTDAFKNELWLVKGVSRGGSASLAEDIDIRCEELLNDAALSISDSTLLYLRRESTVDYGQADSGEMIHHVGGLYRCFRQPLT